MIPNQIAASAKAVLAGVAAGLAYLIGVISTDATLSEAFAGMTANQWIGLALTVLGSYGITWTVPNRTLFD